MKKVLTTLLMSAGMAVAAMNGSEFKEELQDILEQEGYEKGDSFTLYCKLGKIPINTSFFQFHKKAHLTNFNHVFWGLNTQKNNHIPKQKFASYESSGNTHTYTSKPRKMIAAWCCNEKHKAGAQRFPGDYIELNISCDGKDSAIALSYQTAPDVDTFILKGTVLDAFRFNPADDLYVGEYSLNVEKAFPSGLLLGGGLAGGAAILLGGGIWWLKRKNNNKTI